MDIKTEVKIHIIFYQYVGCIAFGIKFGLYLTLLISITGMFFDFLGFSIPVTYISTPPIMFIFILVLSMIPFIIYAIFEKNFSKINFDYNHLLLCYLLLKEHHSSSNLNLEINKLKRAIENKSQLYNDLSKSDFPYINKFISRYYRYKDYSGKNFNHTLIKNVVKDDLLQLSKSEFNTQSLMLENTSFEQLDDVLGNLVKDQIKQKTVVNNK